MIVTDAVLLIGSVTAGIASLVNTWLTIKNATKVEAIHLATNSMKDALVASTRKDALQEGVTLGAQQVHEKLAADALKTQVDIHTHDDAVKEGFDKGVLSELTRTQNIVDVRAALNTRTGQPTTDLPTLQSPNDTA